MDYAIHLNNSAFLLNLLKYKLRFLSFSELLYWAMKPESEEFSCSHSAVISMVESLFIYENKYLLHLQSQETRYEQNLGILVQLST